MKKLQIRKVGNSMGVLIPKEIVEQHHLKEGDCLHLIETDEGFTLTPYDPDFTKVMAAYEKFSTRYRNALKELARERTSLDE